MASHRRRPGEFCFINMLTPRPADARAFFSELLEWTFDEMPGMGHLIKVDGHGQGGLFDLAGPGTPPGLAPSIGVMIRVDDAEAMAAKVRALGGRAQPPMDIGGNGRMVVCHDPGGAAFDLWEPRAQQGTDVDGAAHGAFSWFEVLTRDMARDTRFYCELFGWSAERMPMPDLEYTTFRMGDTFVAGMMALTPAMEGAGPEWGTYFTVRGLDEAVRRTAQLGGTIFVPPQGVPGVGRFAGVVSPQGVRFYVMQYER